MPDKSIMSRLAGLARKHTLPAMFLTAALTVVILMLIVRVPVSVNNSWYYPDWANAEIEPENGAYDLTGVDFSSGEFIVLPAGDFNYPNAYLTPEETYDAEPADAEDLFDIRAGYITQRLVLMMPETDAVYRLNFWVYTRFAYRVYINGELTAFTGVAGTNKQDTVVWENSLTCYASPKDGKMEIVLHLAQFYHYEQGAHGARLRIAAAPPEPERFISAKEKGFIVIGVLSCAAILLFCLWLMAPHMRATFYFSLACAVLALRECIMSGAWTSISFLSGNTAFMLEYLGIALTGIFVSLYLLQSIKKRFGRVIFLAAIFGSVVYGALVFLTDSIFYTRALQYYQMLNFGCMLFGLPVLFMELRRPLPERTAALFGITVFSMAAVTDVLLFTGALSDSINNITVSETAMVIFVLAQTVSLFLMNNRIVAEAKEAERKLAAENEALDGMNRLKTEFLQNVSHDFKTPITSIDSHALDTLTELSEETLNIPEMESNQNIIRSASKRLERMVSQLLEVSALESGRIILRKKPLSLSGLLAKAAGDNNGIITQNGNRIMLEIPDGLPEITADADMIESVVTNLISNAARHTRQGIITISLSAPKGMQKVCVADTGDGIFPDLLKQVFVKYIEREIRVAGSTGLGLYICKRYIDAHGGEMSIESEPGKGTAVWFSIHENDTGVENNE